jgi:hypothetical protein
MDELRARAYLDLLLDQDSRPRPAAGTGRGGPGDGGPGDGGPGDGGPGNGGPGDGGPGNGGSGPGGADGPAPGSGAGRVPAGFGGRINLTTPLATALGLAARPGEVAGIGPVDPDPEANTFDRYQNGASISRQPLCPTVRALRVGNVYVAADGPGEGR